MPNVLDLKADTSKSSVKRKRYLIFLLVVVIFIGVVVFLKLPSSPLEKFYPKKPAVEVKTTYKNPFEKETQYVNPFEEYKNPFVTNR